MADELRIIVIVAQQTFVLLFFSILIFRLLRNERSMKTLSLALFYFLNITFTSLNLIYVFIRTNPLTFWLHFLSVYMMLLSPVFYYVFNMMILKSEEVLNVRLERYIIGIYSSTLFVTMFIFGFIFQGIKINESTSWKPVWNVLIFVIPMYILITCICLIPSVVRFIQLLLRIKNEELRKRWKILTCGFFILIGIGYGVFIYNSWDNTIFKTIWLLNSLILTPSAALMIYYGFRSIG